MRSPGSRATRPSRYITDTSRRVTVCDGVGLIHVDTTEGERLQLAPRGRESYALWVLGLNAAMACAAGKAMAAAPMAAVPWVL